MWIATDIVSVTVSVYSSTRTTNLVIDSLYSTLVIYQLVLQKLAIIALYTLGYLLYKYTLLPVEILW